MPITTRAHRSEFLSFPDDFHTRFPFAKNLQQIHQGLEVPETGIYRCATCWHESLMIEGRTIQSEHVEGCDKTKWEFIVYLGELIDGKIICGEEKGKYLFRSITNNPEFNNFHTVLNQYCNHSEVPYTGVYQELSTHDLYRCSQGAQFPKDGWWQLILATNAEMNDDLKPEFSEKSPKESLSLCEKIKRANLRNTQFFEKINIFSKKHHR